MNVSPFRPFVSVLSFPDHSPSSPPTRFVSVLSFLPPLFLLPLSLRSSPQGAHYITKGTSECHLSRQAISLRLWNRLTNRRCASLYLSPVCLPPPFTRFIPSHTFSSPQAFSKRHHLRLLSQKTSSSLWKAVMRISVSCLPLYEEVINIL